MPEPTPLLPLLTGSFSLPAGSNPTGAMVEAAYSHHGLLARYVNCEVTPVGLQDAVHGAVAMGWIGFNLSIPHKESVIPLLDGLAPSAQLIGAVNCVVVGPDGLVGENTDGAGFLTAVRGRIDPANRHVVVFGAGGASRAICVELALAGAASIRIVNRNRDRADAIAGIVNDSTGTQATAEAWDGPYELDGATEIVVNATSIGLDPATDARVNVVTDSIQDGMLVCDVIPNPPNTVFLREAAGRGARTVDGRAMLVNQAAINIERWTGLDPDQDVMRSALDAAIGSWRHPTP